MTIKFDRVWVNKCSIVTVTCWSAVKCMKTWTPPWVYWHVL